MACISPTLARPGAALTSASRRGYRRGGRSRGAARPRGEARFRGAVVAAGKASDDASQQQVGEKGYVAGEGVLSMDKLMEVPIRRFKPTSEECPFCRDAPVKENGSKCLGICRESTKRARSTGAPPSDAGRGGRGATADQRHEGE